MLGVDEQTTVREQDSPRDLCPKCGGLGWYTMNGMRFLCSCQLAEQRVTRRRNSRLPAFEKRPLSQVSSEYIANYDRIKRSGRNWLVFFGKSGSGKTTQAFMIVDRLLDRPKSVSAKVFVYSELVRELSSYRYDADQFENKLADTLESELVVFDDFLDVIPRPDSFEEQISLTLIKRRYIQRLPLIITTEHTPQALQTKLPAHGEAIIGRLYEMCNGRFSIAPQNATNYRLQVK